MPLSSEIQRCANQRQPRKRQFETRVAGVHEKEEAKRTRLHCVGRTGWLLGPLPVAVFSVAEALVPPIELDTPRARQASAGARSPDARLGT